MVWLVSFKAPRFNGLTHLFFNQTHPTLSLPRKRPKAGAKGYWLDLPLSGKVMEMLAERG